MRRTAPGGRNSTRRIFSSKGTRRATLWPFQFRLSVDFGTTQLWKHQPLALVFRSPPPRAGPRKPGRTPGVVTDTRARGRTPGYCNPPLHPLPATSWLSAWRQSLVSSLVTTTFSPSSKRMGEIPEITSHESSPNHQESRGENRGVGGRPQGWFYSTTTNEKEELRGRRTSRILA